MVIRSNESLGARTCPCSGLGGGQTVARGVFAGRRSVATLGNRYRDVDCAHPWAIFMIDYHERDIVSCDGGRGYGRIHGEQDMCKHV